MLSWLSLPAEEQLKLIDIRIGDPGYSLYWELQGLLELAIGAEYAEYMSSIKSEVESSYRQLEALMASDEELVSRHSVLTRNEWQELRASASQWLKKLNLEPVQVFPEEVS